MKLNEGLFDRVARITIGYLLLSSFFLLDGNVKWLTLIGILPLATGLTGWCPAYAPFGFSTCARRS
jgi:hypothetical protein